LNQATRRAVAGDYSARADIKRSDELGQLGQNFNLLTSTLESNTEVQKKMMADISHELRTPVSVLLAGIEAIQDGIHQADEKTLNLLHQQTNTLKHLINDLHQLSVTDLGNMQYKMTATNLIGVLTQAIDSLRLKAEKRNINLVNQINVNTLMVFGDFNRLMQLFTNIIDNSIDYTNQGGEVVISITEQAGQILVEIEDSAPGLLPDEMAQMFDRLYRKEGSRNKKFGGSGLGLAISKNIVEAHNGGISAKASALGGVHLTVRIPKHV
jgi:two-component system sensor histidine kinase BaeS